MDPVLRVRKQGPCFTASEEDGGDKSGKRLVQACETNGLFCYVLFKLTITAVADAIPVREQVSAMHRVAARYLKLVTFSNIWPFIAIPALMSHL